MYSSYVYPATSPTPMPTIAQPPTQAPTLSAKDMMIVYISLGVFVGLIIILICACWYCQCCCFASVVTQPGYEPLNQQGFNGNNPMNQQGFNQQQPGFQPGFFNNQMSWGGGPPVMA